MQIFIYTNESVDSSFEKIENAVDYICFNSKREIETQYNVHEKPILVILSQPSRQVELLLSDYIWHEILSHKGIRLSEAKLKINAYFENDYEFGIEIEKSKKTQWLAIRQKYIEELGHIDEEDYQYLKNLAGVELNIKKKMTKKSSFVKKRDKKVDFFGIITVVNTVETAIDLANEISSNINGMVLVLDGDLLMPCIDEKMKITKIHTSINSHITGIDNTGINIALDTMAKGLNLEEHIDSIVIKKSKSFHVLLGNYNLFNYEHYDDLALKKLIKKLNDIYQVVLISVPLFPYDAMTMLSLHISHINIFGIEKTISETRYMYQYIKLLSTKQGLLSTKNLIIAKNTFKRTRNIGNLVMKDVFGDRYLGNQQQKKYTLLKKIVERI